MLAEAFAGIQPEMRFEEMIEVSKIYSVSGLLSDERPLVTSRPFRRVHHTASAASIVGGGRDSRPGEISLAHRGALFLDELLEFDQRILETLRQPLEDGEITVNRVSMSVTYPARCQLVAAMNPCPCGYMGDPEIPCKDSPREIERYRRKLSGPMLDRIDLVVHVPRVKTEEISGSSSRRATDTSEQLRTRVQRARALQTARFADDGIHTNAEMANAHIERYCVLDDAARAFLVRAVEKFSLSTRAYFRLLRVARTIADLDAREAISMADCAEALSYRSLPD
jgi:magnesium chelatase family protein